MNINPIPSGCDISTTFPSSNNMVGPVRNFIGEIIKTYGFNELQTKIELCVEEIVNNIIEHGYQNDPNYKIDIKVVISSRIIELSFYEKGIPFDPAAVKPFDIQTLKGGLGTKLVKSLSDTYEFVNLGREGKLLKISFINEHPELVSAQPDASSLQQPVILKPEEIIYTQLKEEDATHLARLAWMNYGYSYESYIYYPDEVKTKLRNKTIVAFAAWYNEILIGNLAIKKDSQNPDFPEMGIAIVSPEYRRNNIFQNLITTAINYLLENKFAGVFARAVTNHIISQKSAVDQLKMTPTNIMLCSLPENAGSKNLANSQGEKLSAITLVKHFYSITRSLYLPEKYNTLISEIYQWSDIKITKLNSSDNCISGPSQFTVSTAKDLNTAFVLFDHIGIDFETAVKNQIKEITDDGYPVIVLYLNLNDPGITAVIEFLNHQLFIFSGIQIGHFKQNDALLLQRIVGININFESIKIYSEPGNYLLDQIKSEYHQLNL